MLMDVRRAKRPGSRSAALGLLVIGLLALPVAASAAADVVLRQVGDVHCGMQQLQSLPDGQAVALGKCGRSQLLQRIAADGSIAETRLEQWTLGGDNILFGAVTPAPLADGILLGWYSGVDGDLCEFRLWRPGASPRPLANRRVFGSGCFGAARVDEQSSIIVGRNLARRQVIVQRIVADGRFQWFGAFPDSSVAGTMEAVPQAVSFADDGTVAIVGYFRHTGLGIDGQLLLSFGVDGVLRHQHACAVSAPCSWAAALPVDGDVVAVARLSTGLLRVARIAPDGTILVQADLPSTAQGQVRLLRKDGRIAVAMWSIADGGPVDLAVLDLQLQPIWTATEPYAWSAGVAALSSSGAIGTFGRDTAQQPVMRVFRPDGSVRSLALGALGPINDACCIDARPGGFLVGASARVIDADLRVVAADALRSAVGDDAEPVWSGAEGPQTVPTEPSLLVGDSQGVAVATTHIDRTQAVIWRRSPTVPQVVASASLPESRPRALWARGDGALAWVIGASGRASVIGGIDSPGGAPWSVGLPDGGDEVDALAWGVTPGIVLRWPGGAPERAVRAIRIGPGGGVLADSGFPRALDEFVIGARAGMADRIWLHTRRNTVGTIVPLRRIELDGAANILRDETLDLSLVSGEFPTIVEMPLGRWLVLSRTTEADRFDVRLLDGPGPPVWQRLVDAPPGTTPQVKAAGTAAWLAFAGPAGDSIRLQAIDADGAIGPLSPAIASGSGDRFLDCSPEACVVVGPLPTPQSACGFVASVVASDGRLRSSGERRTSHPCRFVAATMDNEFAWAAWTVLEPGTVQAAVLSPIASVSFSNGFE